MRVFRFFSLIALIVCISHLMGCAGKTADQNDPAALMAEVEEDIKSDHYQVAMDKLRMIKNRFPYSKFAIDAQLKLADVYFMQESYAEAAAAYESFADLHPKHEKSSYALYRAAKSHYNDMPSTVARDMGPAQKAEIAYGEFLRKFPNAPETAEAKTDLAEIRKQLAEKEMMIGDFYSRRAMYDSAIPRYRKVMDLYADTPVAEMAAKKLASLPVGAPTSDSRK